MSRRIFPTVLGEVEGFPGIGLLPIFWPLMVGLRTIMELVGVPFSMLKHCSEHVMRVKVHWKLDLLPLWA